MIKLRSGKGGIVHPQVARVIEKLGLDISYARRVRRITADDFAKRIGVSRMTLHRLERGDPGISLNTLALALNALGLLGALADLVDISKDEIGLIQMRGDAPRRVTKRRRKSMSETNETAHDANENENVSKYEGW